MRKQWVKSILIGMGIIVVLIGIFLLINLESPTGVMLVLPYACIGVGGGMFGHGMGAYIEQKAYEKNPQLQKQQR